MKKLLPVILLTIMPGFFFNLSAAASSGSIYNHSEASTILSDDDIFILRVFEENEIELESWTASKLTDEIFAEKVRVKALKDFNFASKDPDMVSDFKAQFLNNRFDYNYDEERKLRRYYGEREELYDYELRKAFAEHVAKKVGEYHFNRIIKYNPKIEKVVKTVENIDVEVKISEPQNPGGKPTKFKFKARPFKTEMHFQYLSQSFDSTLKYRIDRGELSLSFEKPSEFVNLSFGYNIGKFKYNRDPAFDRTFTVCANRKIYNDITAKLTFEGENGSEGRVVNYRKVHLGFNIPL